LGSTGLIPSISLSDATEETPTGAEESGVPVAAPASARSIGAATAMLAKSARWMV
jgi:hypothetical protein